MGICICMYIFNYYFVKVVDKYIVILFIIVHRISYMKSLDNFKVIKDEVYKLQSKSNLIVVTKNQTFNSILPIIESGHIHFGENRVQEAKEKWGSFLSNNKNIKLHLLGKLQSNKAKEAFALFDFIHTRDSIKLAKIFFELEKNSNKNVK